MFIDVNFLLNSFVVCFWMMNYYSCWKWVVGGLNIMVLFFGDESYIVYGLGDLEMGSWFSF